MKNWTRYTKEQEQFLIDNAGEMDIHELSDAFNRKFGTSHLPETLRKKSLRLGTTPKKYEFTTQFTSEMDDFLREHAKERTYVQLKQMIFERFGKDIPKMTISDHCRIHLGIFKPAAFVPPGEYPNACKPIGSERIDKGRTVMVKVGQPDVWKTKTSVILGDIPKDKQVIFLDGNSLNVTEENMLVVDKKIHARLAKNGWLNSNSEVIKTGVKWAELLYTLKEFEN